jgi:hypothetical protein
VDGFFAMKSKIVSGEKIIQKDWDSLFNTKGYSISATSSMRKNIVKEMMLTAFDKNLKEKRDSILNIPVEQNLKNVYMLLSQMTLANYMDYSENEAKIKKFKNEYDFSAIPKLSAERLKSFLIDPVDSLIKVPVINFLCYEPDAQSKAKGIVCDFNLFSKESAKERINFIAHETFHKYRRNFADRRFINSHAVLRQIDRIQDEGIADLIDKKENLRESVENKGIPEPFVKKYLEAYENTPQILKKFDGIINSYLNKEIDGEQLESKVDNYFLSGGHPNGYYMSRMIVRAGLKNEMLTKFYSPVDFIKIYNKAARIENGYVFSDSFINYLESLK